MSIRQNYVPKTVAEIETIPFGSAEEAWFWFIDTHQALLDGVQLRAGNALYPRPCEPIDILQTVDRLYRKRRLIIDHVLVLRHYGKRRLAPDPWRHKEARAATLWQEALDRLEDILIAKKIVVKSGGFHESHA